MKGFATRSADATALEAWVDDLRPGDVVLHARRGGPDERRSLRFRDPVATLALTAGGDVHALLRDLEAALRRGQAIAGYLGYEAGAALLDLPAPPPPAYALAWFGVYDQAEVVDPGPGGAPLGPPAEARGTLGDPRLELSPDAWATKVAAVQRALAAGESYQVNLTTGFGCSVGDVRQAYRALSASQPVPFGALLDTGEIQVASCSPELFVRATRDPGGPADGGGTRPPGLRLTTRPMKGTAPRRADAGDDARAASDLRADPKSRAENVMIVDLLRHDLGRLARPGSVAVPDLLRLEPYRTVWQLTSTVVADARPDVGLADLLAALFPCGSVTGAPKRRTMALIGELEDAPRGVYTGAIGFALPDPHGAVAASVWSVAIRTLVVQGGGGRLGVGGGIVIDSDAAAEHAELLAKARFLTHPLPAPTPFETMRWEPGGVRRWARHRDRLARSAAALGLPFDPAAAEAAVAAAVADAVDRDADADAATRPPPPVLRVRLALAEDGACRAEAWPHEDGGDAPLVVAWSDVPIAAGDPARRHKTTDRGVYDAASAWARAAGVADVVFLNEEGRVAEGAISNLFLLGADGRWRTPPVADGALPGVLRSELLERGAAVEAPLLPADLRAGTLAIGNALRGLRPVRLDESRRWSPRADAGAAARAAAEAGP